MQALMPWCATFVRGKLPNLGRQLHVAASHRASPWPIGNCSPFLPTPVPFRGSEFPKYGYPVPLLHARIRRHKIGKLSQPRSNSKTAYSLNITKLPFKNSVCQKGL